MGVRENIHERSHIWLTTRSKPFHPSPSPAYLSNSSPRRSEDSSGFREHHPVNLSLTYSPEWSGWGGMNISFIDMQDKNILGFCEKRGSFYHLSFSHPFCFPKLPYEVLKEVVGHEFAHYVDGLVNGQHGSADLPSRNVRVLGRGSGMTKPTTTSLRRSSVVPTSLRRIKKLLALRVLQYQRVPVGSYQGSEATHEEHGIQERESSNEHYSPNHPLPYAKLTQEYNTIIHIVRQISNTARVLPLSSPSGEKVIYAHGTKTECEIASYLFDYLKRELSLITTRQHEGHGIFPAMPRPPSTWESSMRWKKRFQSQKIAEVGTGLSSL